MPDREKVIKGLECCILRDPDDHARCSKCPYGGNCVNRLKMDALELLKEQESRVMTLAQMQSLEDFTPIWFEYSAGNETTFEPAFLKFETNRYHLLHDTKTPAIDDRTYLKDWRCWTSRPTEEQRKATPWEPPKEG